MNYEQFLIDLLAKDEKYIVVTAENRAAIRNLPNYIKDRFIDTGITEQTMIGMSAGLALRGRIPIVHALATFLTLRAFEFIRSDIGLGNLPVKLVGAVAGFLSEANGPTHQALEDVSLLRGIPNMNVFCPSDEVEMLSGLEKILPSPDPWYIRYANSKPLVEHKEFEPGKAEVLFEGTDVTILTYGFMLTEAVKAFKILTTEGKSVGLVNMRTLKPIDKEIVLKVCRSGNLVITLEDHFLTGGLFSIVSEILVSESVKCRVYPIALRNWFKPALLKDVLEYEGFTGEQIAKTISKELDRVGKEVWQIK